MSLRVRLLAAVAYVLVLVIVALEVPLALTIVAAHREPRCRRQRLAPARRWSPPAPRGGSTGRAELSSIATRAASDLGGRVLILDATGKPLADSAGPDRADDTYVGRPRWRRRWRATRCRARATPTRSTRTCCTRQCPCSTRARRSARCG